MLLVRVSVLNELWDCCRPLVVLEGTRSVKGSNPILDAWSWFNCVLAGLPSPCPRTAIRFTCTVLAWIRDIPPHLPSFLLRPAGGFLKFLSGCLIGKKYEDCYKNARHIVFLYQLLQCLSFTGYYERFFSSFLFLVVHSFTFFPFFFIPRSFIIYVLQMLKVSFDDP